MYRLFSTASLVLVFTGLCCAAELQGVITDWNCTEDMVRNGRAKVLKQRRSCSLAHDYRRSAYGLITDDKKFYQIDPQDNGRVLEILSNSPNKDNLKVIISGELQGNKIHIDTISLL